jgi:hypothetical protein
MGREQGLSAEIPAVVDAKPTSRIFQRENEAILAMQPVAVEKGFSRLP